MNGTRYNKVYHAWQHMKARCYNPKCRQYKYYGARGITVCRRWKGSFESFAADMGPRPEGGSLERVDNSKGYSPKNCRWATQHEQTRNTRQNRHIAYAGRTQCLTDWCRELGVNMSTLKYRIKTKGVTTAFAMLTRKEIHE